MPAAAGQLLPCADHWQVLHPAHLLRGQRLHLYEASPVTSRRFPRPAACNLAPGQQSGAGGAAQRQGRGRGRGTIGGSRRISFRAVAR